MSEKMKPMFILPVGQVSKQDLNRLRQNGICVIEAKDPASVRWCDPYPEGRSIQERAAIELCRTMLREGIVLGGQKYRDVFTRLFTDILLRGDPLKEPERVPQVKTKP